MMFHLVATTAVTLAAPITGAHTAASVPTMLCTVCGAPAGHASACDEAFPTPVAWAVTASRSKANAGNSVYWPALSFSQHPPDRTSTIAN